MMHKTKNDLPHNTRLAMIELLQGRLADAVDLATQIKQAHWNVKGPSFIGLHELFDLIVGEVREQVDEIAERLVALGGVAKGTARVAAQTSALPEYPLDISAGQDHVDALATALAAFGGRLREAIGQADEAGDADTADLFTEVSRLIDKRLWMVEAHRQAER